MVSQTQAAAAEDGYLMDLEVVDVTASMRQVVVRRSEAATRSHVELLVNDKIISSLDFNECELKLHNVPTRVIGMAHF